jgi:hypothetical protein
MCRDNDADFAGEALQLNNPQSGVRGIPAAAIGGDYQTVLRPSVSTHSPNIRNHYFPDPLLQRRQKSISHQARHNGVPADSASTSCDKSFRQRREGSLELRTHPRSDPGI